MKASSFEQVKKSETRMLSLLTSWAPSNPLWLQNLEGGKSGSKVKKS